MRSVDSIVVAAVVACGLGALLGGCTPREKDEAAILIHAVERVRAAPDLTKRDAVPMLREAPCSAPELCAVKQGCVTFAERTVVGLERKAEVEAALADVKAGKLKPEDPAAAALPGKLDEAAQALKEGEAALLKCDADLAQLRRRWQI